MDPAAPDDHALVRAEARTLVHDGTLYQDDALDVAITQHMIRPLRADTEAPGS